MEVLMAKMKFLPFFLFIFIASKVNSADSGTDKLKNNQISDAEYLYARQKKMSQMRKDSLAYEKPTIHKKLPPPDIEAVNLGTGFKNLITYVLKKYPSAITGLYHALKHDLDNHIHNNLSIWEIWTLKDILKIKPKIFEKLLNLASSDHDDFLTEDPMVIDKIKRELFAGLLMDLSRTMAVFTPTAWEISKEVIKLAYTEIFETIDQGMRLSHCLIPLAYAGVGFDLVNTSVLIKRGEHFVFTSFKYSHFIFPLELINNANKEKIAINKRHQKGSYLERWLVGAMALVIVDLNYIGVMANYGRLGVDLAQLAAISASLISGAIVAGGIASASLSMVNQGIHVKAKRASAKIAVHKKTILTLVSRLLSSNTMIDYLKDLGILQRGLAANKLSNAINKFGKEKLWVFNKLMAITFSHYLFP
jgi:hypothetical protein